MTLVLKSNGGVAQTGGIDLDNDHKEILFSLDYIGDRAKSGNLGEIGLEIKGVLVHEMVHAWQLNGKGRAPGGLIEGIADFVRLKAELSPPHWKKEKPEQWDAGYQTTAFFLEWLESTRVQVEAFMARYGTLAVVVAAIAPIAFSRGSKAREAWEV